MSICLIIRNENKYLREWLTHHLPIADHIYIYDNGDKENVSDIIESMSVSSRHKITVIPYNEGYEHIQEQAYNHFLKYYKNETIWAAFTDSDEFIEIDCDKTLHEVLKEMNYYNELRMYWTEYGANGRLHYEDEPVQKRFKCMENQRQCRCLYKSFIKVSKVVCMVSHFAAFDRQNNIIYEDKKKNMFHIDHYYTKSFEEWKEKMARGSSNPRCLKNFNEFFAYNPDMAYLKSPETDLHGQSYNAGRP